MSALIDEFSWPVRVYYEDTDAGGVVYHANYLKFMERARTEWLRALDFEQDDLREQGFLFAVTRLNLDYRLPALFNQQLIVKTQLSELKRASFEFAQSIWRDNTCLVQGNVTVACLAAESFKVTRLPAQLNEVLKSVS